MSAATLTQTRTVTVAGVGPVPVGYTERGEGRPFLLLHGGAGPQSVTGFAELLADSEPAHVIVPTHPGFGGTARPEGLDSMKGIAELYAGLLDDLGLAGVTVVGNSIGGWIAAELALHASERIAATGSSPVGGVVLVDAAGLQIDAYPVPDFFTLTMDQVADLSYFDPDAFRIDVASLPEQQRAMMAANRAALQTYSGAAMADPGLLGRLAGVALPTLVVWGAADRIIPVEHGHAYAAAIPGAAFHLISDAGHLPQLEAPDQLLRLVWDFTAAPSSR
jgi:pimeloyl-ACP methyl ester carboxylesterase